MPSYLQIENISKSYGTKVLFEHIAFNINEGDKIALIAPNGTGKTSLLKILAGKDRSDSGGSIKFLRDVRIAFLEQDPPYDPSLTVIEQVLSSSGATVKRAGRDSDAAAESAEEAAERELRARKLVSQMGLREDSRMSGLSGGEVKRVALCSLLSQGADFLVMDEPTNHLDLDGIEFLEGYLKSQRCTLFMVTHDRYFLDRVCNTVMELDRGAVYVYKGDYENFLEKREERIASYNAQTEKVRNTLRRELEWMHATPCARSGKAKYRKQAFWELKDRAGQAYIQREVSMDELGSGTRLGSKVINCKDLNFAYGDRTLVRGFTYNFQRGERVGIVGANGVGKTTFLNLLATGTCPGVERGESLRIGYYRQEGFDLKGDETVLDTVSNTHLLDRFLFPHEMYSNRVRDLSGGEKRRLYLLTILMREPNLLILDEPTNDLDIVTLNVLEDYLLEFHGTLIVVTHDRHFLDRLVDHLLVFCGDGAIKDFIGSYTEYRCFIKDLEAEKRRAQNEQKAAAKASVTSPAEAPARPRRLSFKEKRELDELDARIAALTEEKEHIESALSGSSSTFEEVSAASVRYAELKSELDEAETRWLELSCI